MEEEERSAGDEVPLGMKIPAPGLGPLCGVLMLSVLSRLNILQRSSEASLTVEIAERAGETFAVPRPGIGLFKESRTKRKDPQALHPEV